MGGWGGPGPNAPDEPFVGEGRLVFGATDQQGKPLPGGWTVIFEYRLPNVALQVQAGGVKESTDKVRNLATVWANRWHALRTSLQDGESMDDARNFSRPRRPAAHKARA